MAISAQKVRQAEPSSRLVLALAGAMLAILCVLVLMAAAANRGGTVRTFSQPATVSVGQGAGDHARSEKGAGGQDDGSGQTASQPTHGPLP
ncbi:MAG: hypothetical protein ABI838_09810 [Chloroflexota bacterium]